LSLRSRKRAVEPLLLRQPAEGRRAIPKVDLRLIRGHLAVSPVFECVLYRVAAVPKIVPVRERRDFEFHQTQTRHNVVCG
jgi:hypothetical protein